jgi:hypothetical protein
LLLDFASLFVDQADTNPQRSSVSDIAVLALSNVVLGFAEDVVNELEHKIACEVLDW